MAFSPRTRTLRWSAPLAVMAVIALLAAVPNLAGAATPSVAPLTPQQLIVKIHQADVSTLSGTLKLTTNLGIPNLGDLSAAASGGGGDHHGRSGFNPTDLLSGSHQASVWFDGPEKQRIALIQSMAETDVVHNGHDVWTWDSTGQKVTHYTLSGASSSERQPEAQAQQPIKTPAQMADDLLAHIDASTAVTVTNPVMVANQDSYQLVLTPKAAASTVDRVVIAADAATGLPLRVQVFAKGQKAVAVQLGFSSISYSKPAASNFSFTPPPSSSVTNKQVGPHSGPPTAKTPTEPANSRSGSEPVTVGQDWSTVAIISGVTLPAQVNQYLQAATPVSGTFGSGRLLGTPLVNVLVLNDGRIAVGAVTASALEATVAAGH